MSDSTTIKPLISNKESRLISLEMELGSTCALLAMQQYTSETERKDLEKYKKHISDQIMELTILGGE